MPYPEQKVKDSCSWSSRFGSTLFLLLAEPDQFVSMDRQTGGKTKKGSTSENRDAAEMVVVLKEE